MSEKNNTPFNITLGSDKKITWCCKECDHKWSTQVKSRALKDTGCPKCMERFNVSYPEMVLFFYFKKGFKDAMLNCKIESIEPYESVDLFVPSLNLIIEYDGFKTHEHRDETDTEKSKLILEQGYNLFRIRDNGLQSLNIEGMKELLYIRDSNNSIQYMFYDLLDLLIIKFNEERQSFKYIKKLVDVNNDNMAILSVLPPIVLNNNLKDSYPAIEKIWDYEKNARMRPEHFKPYSNYMAWFKCDNQHSYLAQIGSKRKGHGCMVCDGQVATEDNNLALKFPSVVKEWNYVKNNKKPTEYLPYSNKEVYWNCQACNSTYDKKINERTSGGEGCPYCVGKRVNSTNSLAVTHKELIKEWDFSKNVNITPDKVTRGSSKEIWWICQKNHSFKARVSSRTRSNGTNCPICYELFGRTARIKVKKENSILIKKPLIAKQWNKVKNGISPDQIGPYARKEYWWICEKGHEFKASPNSRRSPKCRICKN